MGETGAVCVWLLLAGIVLAGNLVILVDIERERCRRRERRRRWLARSLLDSR